MDFEWDESESDANFEARGFDFDYARRIFDGPVLEAEDVRKRYGEIRMHAIGLVEGDVLSVIYTDAAMSAGSSRHGRPTERNATRGDRSSKR